MTRRAPPPLLEPLSAADRSADQWLRAHGCAHWRWPRMQGAQPRVHGDEDREDLDLARSVPARGQVALDQGDLQLEAVQTLQALQAAGRIDAQWRRTVAASIDDEPALPVVEAARRARRSVRSIQVRMQTLHDVEQAGQMELPCLPGVSEVYRARPAAPPEVTP